MALPWRMSVWRWRPEAITQSIVLMNVDIVPNGRWQKQNVMTTMAETNSISHPKWLKKWLTYTKKQHPFFTVCFYSVRSRVGIEFFFLYTKGLCIKCAVINIDLKILFCLVGLFNLSERKTKWMKKRPHLRTFYVNRRIPVFENWNRQKQRKRRMSCIQRNGKINRKCSRN